MNLRGRLRKMEARIPVSAESDDLRDYAYVALAFDRGRELISAHARQLGKCYEAGIDPEDSTEVQAVWQELLEFIEHGREVIAEAAKLLAQGLSEDDVAATVGISTSDIERWQTWNPFFQKELRRQSQMAVR